LVKIIIVRSNSIVIGNTPRVSKIARSLSKKYSILVLGWNREGISEDLVKDFKPKLDLFNLRAPVGKPSLMLFMPLFWLWVFYKLVKNRPDIVQGCDLDTALPCYLYRKMFRKKFVFDICDRYAMSYVPVKFRIMYGLINSIEEIFGKRADFVITVSEKLISSFRNKPKKYSIIMNCPEDNATASSRDRTNEQEGKLTIAYTGKIRKHRYLENICAALKDLQNVRFKTAGLIIDKNVFATIRNTPNTEYSGVLQAEEALALEGSCDVILAMYDPELPEYSISMPNKLFESMMLGIPIITNIAKEVVEQTGCGVFVNYNDDRQITHTIKKLRDNLTERHNLGRNGRDAFVEKFNWKAVERQLLLIYNNLQSK
jgi:glycosyltransferase involved in cell wall biosynthesis